MKQRREKTSEEGRRWRLFSLLPWLVWLLAVALSVVGLGLMLLGRSHLNPWEGVFVIASVLAFATPGALIAVRRRDNRIGWLFLLFAGIFALQRFSSVYAVYAFRVLNRSLTGATFAAWLQNWLLLLILPLLSVFLMLFPDGRLPSRRWSLLLGMILFVFGSYALFSAIEEGGINYEPLWSEQPVPLLAYNPAAAPALAPFLGPIDDFFWSFGIFTFLLPAIVPLLRYREGDPLTRRQLRWLMILAALLPAVLIAVVIGSELGWAVAPFLGVLWMLIALIGFPAAVSIAILRHDLYDIDLIIRRTLIYGVLTATLAFIYFVTVAMLQSALPVRSELATVISTLVVAALFNPLRRQIQGIIDRRFFRRKYDSVKTLAAFGATVRDEVDLDNVTAELLRVVDKTMQPETVSLWLREQ